MGQSLVFVSMPWIAIEGEETKQDPWTHPPFFYSWLTTHRSRQARAAAVLKNPHLGIGTLSEIHSYTDLKSNSTLKTAPQASWGRRGERQQVLTCSRNRGWRQFTKRPTGQGGKGERNTWVHLQIQSCFCQKQICQQDPLKKTCR